MPGRVKCHVVDPHTAIGPVAAAEAEGGNEIGGGDLAGLEGLEVEAAPGGGSAGLVGTERVEEGHEHTP